MREKHNDRRRLRLRRQVLRGLTDNNCERLRAARRERSR